MMKLIEANAAILTYVKKQQVNNFKKLIKKMDKIDIFQIDEGCIIDHVKCVLQWTI